MRRSLVVLSVVALVLGACGGGGPDPQENPKAALKSAFESLIEAEGITMTLSLRSDTSTLSAVSEGEMSEDVAEKILDSSITVSGRNEDDPKKAQSEISLDLAGIDQAFEMKALGSTLYLRAAVRDIMEVFDANPDDADRFVQDAKQAGFTWAEPAVEGEWLEISGLDELGKQFGASSMEETAAQQRKMLRKLSAALEEHATAEPGDKDGPGDHLVVTINLRDISASLQDIMGALGPMAGAGLPKPTDVPDEDLVLDVWIEDDFVRQIEFDIAAMAERFDGEGIPEGAELALRVVLDEFDDEVEPPDDATKVDTEQLMGIFGGMVPGAGGLGGGGGSSGTEPADICEQLKGAPPEVVEQFAEECPELQPN